MSGIRTRGLMEETGKGCRWGRSVGIEEGARAGMGIRRGCRAVGGRVRGSGRGTEWDIVIIHGEGALMDANVEFWGTLE